MSGIHQFVPTLHHGDAVGRHALRLRDVLVSRGITSRIYVETPDPETAEESQLFVHYEEDAAPGDVLVYQFATASHLAPWLVARPEVLVVNYHNVTPPEHYARWDNGLARHQLAARAQLQTMVARTRLAVAVSSFNEAELIAAGFSQTVVVPPAAMLPVSPPTTSPRPSSQTGTRWLCVGRLAPNKAIEHALMALLVSRADHDPTATLQVVGRPVVPTYTAALQRYVDEMGLRPAVTFRGQLGDDELADVMASADVLVVPSAHEGFGIPVIEAMALGLPVVANAAGALPGIVGDGGLLVDAADPWALAGAVAGILSDPARRRALAAGAAAQLRALDLPSAGDRLADLVSALA